ncbi:MAG TPA: alanine--tRNA ligase [Anaerolineae bacterium]|jgi:alanyl-tRNA synthetase
MTSAEIRQAFLDYFEEHKHTVVASSSLIPVGDPTLLFTNAGMVQFKDAFLGLEKRSYTRAATSQKCMRVAGKHNDLENVGPSPRHHTFFEMLGNFSFGDYFKKDAIRFAYETLTRVYGIPPERLYYTVYQDDDEAFDLWTKDMGIEPERVYRMGDATNFWQMADVGPCGPTSELHYDWGEEYCTCGEPDCSVFLDNGCERWLEIWNLVFMQFNQTPDGSRQPLPKPGVDTGMGLERIVSVVQNKRANYETDLFMPIIKRVQELLGHSDAQAEAHLIAYRVIADHGRAISFMIGDGVMPGNEGRASVLRLILRRAARYGRLAGFDGPFLAKIADTVIDEMGHHYIELQARCQFILNVITQEEERFLKTFNNGLELIAELVQKLKSTEKTEIPGAEVFKLHATYGFPKDLTRLIAEEEYGLSIDEVGYRAAFKQHAEISGGSKIGEIAVGALQMYADLFARLKSEGKLPDSGVEYNPYAGADLPGTAVAILRDGEIVENAGEGQTVELILTATPFYVEAGGQIGDIGQIIRQSGNGTSPSWQMNVSEVHQPVNGLIIHHGILIGGTVKAGDAALVRVDAERRWDIRRNHTATHVLHRELRRALGDHVAQAGSLVAPDRLRFDFSHPQMVGPDELASIEQAINEAILSGYPVSATYQKYDALKQAIASGDIMALFGEKYGDEVRVVQIGSDDLLYSRELCGGTHVDNTAQIGALHITGEGSAAAGVRRIEAVTGRAAQALIQQRLSTLEQTAAALGVPPDEVYQRTLALVDQLQEQEKELKTLQRKLSRTAFESMLSQTRQVKGVNVVALKVDAPDVAMLREISDWFRDQLGSAVIVLGTVINDKPSLIATVTEDLTKRGVHAGNLVKDVAQVVGGGGGGRPTMAQAGGKDPARLDEALERVETLVGETLDG